jgi:hypothetical protein
MLGRPAHAVLIRGIFGDVAMIVAALFPKQLFKPLVAQRKNWKSIKHESSSFGCYLYPVAEGLLRSINAKNIFSVSSQDLILVRWDSFSGRDPLNRTCRNSLFCYGYKSRLSLSLTA